MHWIKNKKTVLEMRRLVKVIRASTEAKALSEDAPRGHVFLSFYLREVERAGKNKHIRQVDEAL